MIKEELFSIQFKSDENVKFLTKKITQEIRYNTHNKRNYIKKMIIEYIDSWTGLGKFKKIDEEIKINNEIFLRR